VKNDRHAYALNKRHGRKGRRRIGDRPVRRATTSRHLPADLPGWNDMVRLYRPWPEVLDGAWTFPGAQPER